MTEDENANPGGEQAAEKSPKNINRAINEVISAPAGAEYASLERHGSVVFEPEAALYAETEGVNAGVSLLATVEVGDAFKTLTTDDGTEGEGGRRVLVLQRPGATTLAAVDSDGTVRSQHIPHDNEWHVVGRNGEGGNLLNFSGFCLVRH